jgi:hypothetical protein
MSTVVPCPQVGAPQPQVGAPQPQVGLSLANGTAAEKKALSSIDIDGSGIV